MGLPHSGHSGGVRGRVSSSMVVSTSTKGTSAIMPRQSNEIFKRVLLFLQLTVFIPLPTFFLSAAHMGNGINKPAVNQRKYATIEACGQGHAIRTIAIKPQWRRAIQLCGLAVKQRYGDQRAIMGRC